MPENKSRKAYRTETPNMVDEWGLEPYSFRLLFHYRRWCGEHGSYDKPVRATASLIVMSPAQVCRARQHLLDQELIRINPDGSVSVTDIWDLNREWFVSGRNRFVSDRNKSVSTRNKLFLTETSPYRKNLLERNHEDTTTTEGESGGGGGGSRREFDSRTTAPEAARSTYTLEQVTEWAEAEPGILMPDRFARARWLDGLADGRVAVWLARREATAAYEAPPPEIEPFPEGMVREIVEMLTTSLIEGRSVEELDRQFSAGVPSSQWVEMRAAALEESRRRNSVVPAPTVERRASSEPLS
jgi:hypothetical protein